VVEREAIGALGLGRENEQKIFYANSATLLALPGNTPGS
jgi:hypothetical protein